MRKKRILVRTLTRVFYAGGIVFLIAGLLLSAISSPVLAANASSPANIQDNIASFFALQQETIEPACVDCETPGPGGVATATLGPGGDAGSSLIFAATCECGCDFVRATVCNVGSEDMAGPVDWRLYFSPDGNPQLGSVVDRGSLGPLEAGQCFTLDNGPGQGGNYMYRVYQEEGYDGPSSIWSSSCIVSGDCFPGPSPTETATAVPDDTATPLPGTPTFTATAPFVEVTVTTTPTQPVEVTRTPTSPVELTQTPTTPVEFTRTPTAPVEVTPTSTREPLPFNMSAICGYETDDHLLWRVYNNTGEDIDYVWQVSGSDETGSGTAPANGTDYFTTSPGQKTVRVYVDDELVDSEDSQPACKEELEIIHTCAADGEGLDWFVRNPNDFSVNISWDLDGEGGGTGSVSANSTIELTTSELGEHTVTVTWTDTRPGEHTVQQTSDIDSCEAPGTTPTFTATAPFVEETVTTTPTQPTRTVTATQPTVTPTATVPFVIVTETPSRTPTPTATVPFVIVTETPSRTPTRTATVPVVTATVPPKPSFTPTATVPFVVVTATPTATVPFVVVTATPTATVPFVVITATPEDTPTPTATVPFIIVTETPSPTATVPFVIVTATPTATVPFVIITEPAKPSFTPTATVPFIVITATPEATFTPTATAPFIIVTATPEATSTPTATAPFIIVTATPEGTPTPTSTVPFVIITEIPTATNTPVPTQVIIVTLPPPEATSTPPIIPITGGDMLAPVMATNLLGNLFTNIGLFMLGLALALTGVSSQWKN